MAALEEDHAAPPVYWLVADGAESLLKCASHSDLPLTSVGWNKDAAFSFALVVVPGVSRDDAADAPMGKFPALQALVALEAIEASSIVDPHARLALMTIHLEVGTERIALVAFVAVELVFGANEEHD